MRNYYRFIIPRMNGEEIETDFRRQLALVRKGIAGFIVFGGKLQQVRLHIKRLQEASGLPLIIASDLERGLGQQLKGGTSFPPAMALAKATKGRGKGNTLSGTKQELLRDSFRALAEEARYAGINTIFAPVLDINTNPDNPIIGVRAFGEDVGTVSFFGTEMIRVLQENGIAACGKHFPGHGDTDTDSHMRLPSSNHSLRSLCANELVPFRMAIVTGVQMLMLGHLRVPAIEPSGIPVSLSPKAVSYLRNRLRFKNILITDAMNMGGLSALREEEACLMALRAGVDILLHPLHAGRVASYLARQGYEGNSTRLDRFRMGLLRFPDETRPDFVRHAGLSRTLIRSALTVPQRFRLRTAPLVVIISDEEGQQGQAFIRTLKQGIPDCRVRRAGRSTDVRKITDSAGPDAQVIAAVFSETRAWKGEAGEWFREMIGLIARQSDITLSFGNPYLLREIPAGKKMSCYWNSESAQEEAAKVLLKQYRP